MKRLELRNVWIEKTRRALLADVSLRLEPGEFVALVGPNGAGKTTLLKAALALHRLTRGEVLLDGRPVSGLAPRERAAQIAWLPQHAAPREALSALDVVATSRYRFAESRKTALAAARAALERVGASGYAERSVRELSGGELQRVLLAALVAQQAPILLVDEPANHLDPAQQIDVYRLLGQLWRDGASLLTITHDVNLLAHVGGAERLRVAGMSEGRLVFEARYADADLPDRLGSLFGLRLRALGAASERVIVPELGSVP
jgi:iron complex transport system ATP-binding protein